MKKVPRLLAALERNHFQCHHCGETPPRVVLFEDPSLRGRLTCTRCKPGRLEGGIFDWVTIQQIEGIQQRQLFEDFLSQERVWIDQRVEMVSEAWLNLCGIELFASDEASIRVFLKELSAGELIDFIDLAVARTGPKFSRSWKYFCGICHRTIQERKEAEEIES